MADPVANLLELQRLAERHRSPELASWLASCLESWLSDDQQDLETALGMRDGTNGRSARYRYREAVRNHALVAASQQLNIERLWPRAESLAREVRSFSRRRWSRWKILGKPPENASQLHCLLFTAFSTGLSVPESTRQLFEILSEFTEGSTPYSFQLNTCLNQGHG